MNSNALVTWKNSILLHDGIVEIHHNGLIWKADQYDKVELCAMNYLHFEGFLEKLDLETFCGDLIHVDDVQIFDGTGSRVTREQLI